METAAMTSRVEHYRADLKEHQVSTQLDAALNTGPPVTQWPRSLQLPALPVPILIAERLIASRLDVTCASTVAFVRQGLPCW